MNALTSMTPVQATALWSGLLIGLLVILGMRVAIARWGHKVVLGDGGNANVLLATRVFGNASEYVPVAVGALAVLAMLQMPAYVLHLLGSVLFVGRLLHATTLSTQRPTMGRVISMSLTWLPLLIAAAMLVVHAFV